MARTRNESILAAAALLLYLSGDAPVIAAEPAGVAEGFAKCKVIDDDQARLACLKKLLAPPPAADPPAEAVQDLWPVVVATPPGGGREAVSIMRTADTTRSDPDLAGLVIGCQDGPGFQVLLALVRPLPPRATRTVVINPATTPSVIHAEASPLGTGLLLPLEPAMFTTGPWRDLKELAVLIQDPQGDIRGVIPLDGLAPAMAKLSARCRSG